ncbi:hypothetical protein DMH17_12195 [Raoultella planticola]|nr:hypothetical protein [Raoultella planticola]
MESSLREEAMIKKGIDFINQHFDQPLTLSEVANHSGMELFMVSRLFKRSAGIISKSISPGPAE